MRAFGRCIVAVLAFAGPSIPALADDFYAGKQVTMIVGSGVGGGYDTYARLVARYMPKYIPGNPSIIVQNLPTAGSLAAMNMLANSSPRDGSVFGAVQTHIGVEPIMGVTGPVENAKYDGRAMNWIGSTAKEYALVVAWHTSPIKRFQDLYTTEMLVGSSGVATSDSVYANLMNELGGTKFRVIDGYKDNPSLSLAMETGEIMGRAGWFLSSLMSTAGQQVADGHLRIIAQVALEKHLSLPDIPLVTDFITAPEKKRQLEFSLSWLPMGRPYVAPPGVPAERVAILRAAFMKSLADPDLLADAKQMNLEISPLSGDDIQKLLLSIYDTPKPVVDSVRKIMLGQ